MQAVIDDNVDRHKLANARDKPQLQLNVEKLKKRTSFQKASV